MCLNKNPHLQRMPFKESEGQRKMWCDEISSTARYLKILLTRGKGDMERDKETGGLGEGRSNG